MCSEHGISLAGIAGITPRVSTFADVLRILGTGYEVERIAPYQTKHRLLPPKIILHFLGPKVMVVFLDPGDELAPEATVTVVGAEQGSPLRTDTGLRVGMPVAEAEEIIARDYLVKNRFSGIVEIVAADGIGENFLALHQESGRVIFIGLYRREQEIVPSN